MKFNLGYHEKTVRAQRWFAVAIVLGSAFGTANAQKSPPQPSVRNYARSWKLCISVGPRRWYPGLCLPAQRRRRFLDRQQRSPRSHSFHEFLRTGHPDHHSLPEPRTQTPTRRLQIPCRSRARPGRVLSIAAGCGHSYSILYPPARTQAARIAARLLVSYCSQLVRCQDQPAEECSPKLPSSTLKREKADLRRMTIALRPGTLASRFSCHTAPITIFSTGVNKAGTTPANRITNFEGRSGVNENSTKTLLKRHAGFLVVPYSEAGAARVVDLNPPKHSPRPPSPSKEK